jgi:hypothetical protein
MALDKVFVSPGVYTSERDLSFVTNNVGVTTLGLVGEVTKGPAFQPIFVQNYNEFKTFFGGLNPKKVKKGGLQYELPYIAKSYLNNSNQLYVTRVLGLSGYDAGVIYNLTISDGGGLNSKTIAVIRARGKYDADENFVPDTNTVDIIGTPTFDKIEIDVTGDGSVDITVSLDKTKKNYITRVLGRTTTDGNTPIFVEEIYPNFIEGIDFTGKAITMEEESAGFSDYKSKYKNAITPYVVSEIKEGNAPSQLFRFHTISDGDSANQDVKISIVNIKPDEREFDVIVRNFHDTDANPVQLERFSKCSMDPTSSNYIARKIGDINGDYVSMSSYILVEVKEDETNVDSYPAGFEGYQVRDADSYTDMSDSYKSEYTQFENKRRTFLGMSDDFDTDILKYKGEGLDPTQTTLGFHMDVDADSDKFVTGKSKFQSETDAQAGDYKELYSRTFTLYPAGGFDGWDIYREERTISDEYTIQRVTAKINDTQRNFNTEAFVERMVSNGDLGLDSDYYAYYEAIRTFSNPEAVNVNVFATPGIDTLNNGALVEATIEMVERERSDSLYVVTTPDMNTDGSVKTAQEVADDMFGKFDSNYTATYWPWVQVNDTENNVLTYIPPTADVMRNIALTDNVAYPWFAVAGFLRGDVKAIKARRKLTQQDRDILYEARINPIATFSGEGIKIFGNKNLQIKDSSLNRVNVRRLLLQTRKLISAVSVRLLFDQNDETLRNDFLRQVNPILENIRAERGLKDFRVELVSSPEDKDRNTLSGKIKIKPTNALEYIELEFDVMSSGASFEDQ